MPPTQGETRAPRRLHRSRPRTAVLVMTAVLLTLFVASCTSYMRDSPVIKTSLAEGNYDAALDRIEKIDQGTSRLVYLYEKGLVLHYQSNFVASNAAFEEAEYLYDDLYTKSATREIGSLLTSDTVLKYRGERYEVALIHYYKILNYLYLGDPEGALVECRKLNQRLKTFGDDESNYVYPNDPFLQYLTGLIYASTGEYNDADVSFRIALNDYGEVGPVTGVTAPSYFYCDLVHVAQVLNDREALTRYQSEELCDTGADIPAGSGVLHLFIECGYTAYKVEQNIVLPIYKDEYKTNLDPDEYAEVLYDRYGHPINRRRKLHYLLRVAVPVLVPSPNPLGDIEARVTADGRTYRSYAQVAENIDLLATNAFQARQGQIMVKSIARAFAKYLAKQMAEDKQGEVAGFLVNALNVATERADVRSWSTLPATIRMTRLVLPEGVHDIEIVIFNVLGGNDDVLVIPGVEINAGQDRFLNYRIY